MDCPLLKIPRQGLRKKVRDAFNSLLVLLGGPEGKERQVDSALRASIIEAVLEFAEASGHKLWVPPTKTTVVLVPRVCRINRSYGLPVS